MLKVRETEAESGEIIDGKDSEQAKIRAASEETPHNF